LSNQVTFSGSTGNTLSVPNGAFFLELLIVDGAGVIEIKDGNGDVITTSATDFAQDHSPLRCDKGITLNGDIAFAKGFVIEDLFLS